MGIIRRTIDHLDRRTFTQLYKSIVRPHLEVSNSAWIPYKKTGHRTNWVCTKESNQANPRVQPARVRGKTAPTWSTQPNVQKTKGDMIETYKILSGVYDEDVGPKLPKGNSTTWGHSKKIVKRGSRLNIRKYFFTLRVATIWNELPEDIVNAKNTQAFKNALDKHWKNHPSKFNYLHNPYSNPC